MKRLLLLLLGLSLVVSLTGCHSLNQVSKFPEAPQILGGILSMQTSPSPFGGFGVLGPGGRDLADAADVIDFLPSLAMDVVLLPLTIWAPICRWTSGSSDGVAVVWQEASASSTEEPLPE